MKTSAIIRIVVWSLVFVVLGGILVSALKPEERMPASEDSSVTVLGRGDTIRIAPDTVDEIKIEWASGDILLETADTNWISISESGVTEEKYALRWRVDGDTLKLYFWEDRTFSLKDIISKDLHIQVPESWVCQELKIDAASADVEIRDLTVTEVDFDGASGTCRLENCQVGNLDLDTASGDVVFAGTLNTLDFDAASASFTGKFHDTPHSLDMDSVSGDLDITLPADCGYTLHLEGLSTHFTTEFDNSYSRSGAYIYGDGRCIIEVDGVSCHVILRVLEETK